MIMAKGWKQTFDDPIPLPGGRQLVTLQAPGNYIAKLPKTEHNALEWQTATEALILAAGSYERKLLPLRSARPTSKGFQNNTE